EEYLDDMVAIVQDENNGESRHMFVAAMSKIKSPKVKEILQRLLEDKDKTISKEAQKALKKIK
ncbi:MAG: HEAT repeat domain-containing protein, partial [Bacteroidota bacterium]